MVTISRKKLEILKTRKTNGTTLVHCPYGQKIRQYVAKSAITLQRPKWLKAFGTQKPEDDDVVEVVGHVRKAVQ